jgi:hypothetical protein
MFYDMIELSRNEEEIYTFNKDGFFFVVAQNMNRSK